MTEPTEDDVQEPDARPSRAVFAVRALLALVLFVIAVAVTSFLIAGTGSPGTPGDDSVAAGRARDMTDHHAQAVDMATIMHGRTKDQAVSYLTIDIMLTQTNQMGQMQGWLNDWGLSLGRTGKPMQWMNSGHGGMEMGSSMQLSADGLMPGMATQAQVNQLRTLPVEKADILFLQLMIKHHQGGVAMAQAALDETDEPVVVQLCRTIVKSQQSEIQLMTQMLKERGATP